MRRARPVDPLAGLFLRPLFGFHHLREAVLDELRKQIGNGYFSERSLARLAGLSQPYVHNILKGEREASLHALDQMCRVAKIDIRIVAAAAPEPEQPLWMKAA